MQLANNSDVLLVNNLSHKAYLGWMGSNIGNPHNYRLQVSSAYGFLGRSNSSSRCGWLYISLSVTKTKHQVNCIVKRRCYEQGSSM